MMNLCFLFWDGDEVVNKKKGCNNHVLVKIKREKQKDGRIKKKPLLDRNVSTWYFCASAGNDLLACSLRRTRSIDSLEPRQFPSLNMERTLFVVARYLPLLLSCTIPLVSGLTLNCGDEPSAADEFDLLQLRSTKIVASSTCGEKGPETWCGYLYPSSNQVSCVGVD